MKRSQLGLSLIEVMVTLAVTSIFVLGIGGIYIGAQRSYSFQENFSRMQENGRYAIEQMTRDIRMAGFMFSGCGPISDINNIVREAYWDDGVDFDLGEISTAGFVYGYTDESDNDVIRVYYWDQTDMGYFFEAHNYNSSSSNIFLVGDYTDRIKSEDVLVVTDCIGHADIFKAHNVGTTGKDLTRVNHSGNFNTPSPKIEGDYTNGGYILRLSDFKFIEYYVEDESLRVNPGAEVLVDGIESLIVRYGVDTDNDRQVDVYRRATDVETGGEWGDVVSVRINILTVSENDNIVPQSQTYFFDTSKETADDRKLRQPITTTVGIRNRLL